jgi:hypothetical protein
MGIFRSQYNYDKDGYKARLTRKQKEKSNFSAMLDRMDWYDIGQFSDFRDKNRIKKFNINYGLMEGILDVELYDDPLCFEVGGQEVSFDYQSVSHYPLISQVAKTVIGEESSKVFKPMIKDNTPEKQTYFKKEAASRIDSYLSALLNQSRQTITQNLLKQSGIEDPYSLSPEQQMELQKEVENQMLKESPESIVDFMKYDFQTPTAKQAQKMLDYLVEYHDIKFKNTLGFKHAVCTAEEYYYEGARNGELVFEEVSPMYFNWGGSLGVEWSQHGTWAKREKWLTYQDVTQRHAMHLSERDLKDLDFYHEPFGGFSGQDIFDTPYHRKMQYEYGKNPEWQKKYGDINIKTKEGQRQMLDMYSEVYDRDLFGHKDESSIIGSQTFGIREAHIVWRDKRILKKVKRIVNDELKTFYLDEFYEDRPEDFEVEKIWVDEIWEGYKLGTYEAKYVNVRPIPYQYKSLDNPFDVDLPYYGKRYNVNNDITKNVSLVDLGKTFNKDFDITMSSLKHDMATNHGKKLLITLNAKPEEYSMQEWMDLIRNSPFIPVDFSKKGLNQLDFQFSKEVDLSKMSDIAGKINMLQLFRDGVAWSMYFSNSRLGSQGQYANTTNIQSSQEASYNQTALFSEQHRLVMEKALQAFLNYARFYYKDNLDKAKVFLDDVSLAELATGPYTSYNRMGVSLSNSAAEIQKLSILKQQALTLIQNGSNPESVLKMILADSETEVQELIRKESKNIEMQRAENIKIQQDQFNATMQQQQQAAAEKLQMEYKMHQEKLQNNTQNTIIDSQKFANQQDIDKNGQNDLLTGKLVEIDSKLKMHNDKMLLEKEKLELQRKLK